MLRGNRADAVDCSDGDSQLVDQAPVVDDRSYEGTAGALRIAELRAEVSYPASARLRKSNHDVKSELRVLHGHSAAHGQLRERTRKQHTPSCTCR
jgi:hypothetical protein